MMKSPKRELVRAGCIEDVEESGTYTLRMEEVIPTPPQAIEVKLVTLRLNHNLLI